MSKAQRYTPMKQALIFIGIVLVVMAGFAGNRAMQSHLGEQARHHALVSALPLTAALAKADAQQKLVLVELSAIWCPTCRELDQTIFNQPRVVEAIEQDFVFARVDYDTSEGKDFVTRYQVAGTPVLLILDNQGNKLTRLPLTFDPSEFIGQLNKVRFAQQSLATAVIGK